MTGPNAVSSFIHFVSAKLLFLRLIHTEVYLRRDMSPLCLNRRNPNMTLISMCGRKRDASGGNCDVLQKL